MSMDNLKKLYDFLCGNYDNLYVYLKNNFLGCKFYKNDKYYIFYIFISYEKMFLSYRENVNYFYMSRINVTNLNFDELLFKINSLLSISFKNKPSVIVKSVRKSKKYNDKLNIFKDKYNNLMLFRLFILPDVEQYLLENNIASVLNLLSFNFKKFDCLSKSLKNNILNLIYYLTSDDSLFFISNYEIILKSNFKIKFDFVDYNRYVDFGLSVGNLTLFLLSSLGEERNVKILSEYMSLSDSKKFTLRELADIYNVSHGRIRDIVNNFCKKLKVYKGEYICLLKDLEKEEFLNYFIVGIVSVYNKNFLKFVLRILNLDIIYDYVIYLTKLFKENLSLSKNYAFSDSRESRLFNLISFPINLSQNNKKVFNSLHPVRCVDSFSKYSGTMKLSKSKSKLEYESLLEKKVLKMFDSCSFVKEIKTQSLVIPFYNKGILCKYYPDIQILTKDGRVIIIEVKPLIHMMSKDTIFKFNLLKDYSLKNGYGYALLDDRYNSFEEIINYGVSSDLEEKFFSYLNVNRYLNFKLYKDFLKNYTVCEKDIVNIVIKNQDKLEFYSRPFKFKCRTKN